MLTAKAEMQPVTRMAVSLEVMVWPSSANLTTFSSDAPAITGMAR